MLKYFWEMNDNGDRKWVVFVFFGNYYFRYVELFDEILWKEVIIKDFIGNW